MGRYLLDEIEPWVNGSPLLRRAAVAGISEPRLLTGRAAVRRAILLLERITLTMLTAQDRRSPQVRALRTALGYCWSVVVAADPGLGVAAFNRMETIDDPDLRWIARENRHKGRMRAAISTRPT
jgi:hypothetical protein